jgi:serine protease Do
MKKFAFSLLIALTGGASALFIEKYIDNQIHSSDKIELKGQLPVKVASYATDLSGVEVDFTRAAESSVNSVVHIKTQGEEEQPFSNDPFYQFFYGQRKPQIRQGSGSGVIISSDGYIVTNNHVIDDADKIEVVLNDKRSFTGLVIGKDPTTDLALIKIEAKDLPVLSYGNSDEVRVGQWVLAVGNPFNLTSTVTAGIVSAKGRNINILENDPQSGLFPIESFIQTDAAVNPGNSGGALVNANGELVGINSAIASTTGSYAGYAFAIPVNIVKKIVADLIEFGTVQRAFIGVSIRDIDAAFAEKSGVTVLNGVYVNGLTEGGAAETAGVKVGDVIMQVNGTAVKNVAELQEQVGKYRPGDKISVVVKRGAESKTISVTLKNKDGNTEMVSKASISGEEGVQLLGANFESCSAEACKKFGISGGVQITNLKAGKLAAAGIKQGFIITSIDNKKVKNVAEMESALQSKSGGTLIQGVYPNAPGKTFYYGIGL